MATVVKDLGAVTAYAYAVEGGYTGTEEEFAALLGNIADDLSQIENLSVTVTTLPAGSSATASYSNGVLALGIPKGDKGDKGDTGATPAFTIGTVTTLAAGNDASASITGTAAAPVLNLGIPKGADGDVSSASMATAYSTSATYAVGDYVWYSGQLYCCTTAISTAESWTAAHWTAVKLAEDVGNLKNALESLTLDMESDSIALSANAVINEPNVISELNLPYGAKIRIKLSFSIEEPIVSGKTIQIRANNKFIRTIGRGSNNVWFDLTLTGQLTEGETITSLGIYANNDVLTAGCSLVIYIRSLVTEEIDNLDVKIDTNQNELTAVYNGGIVSAESVASGNKWVAYSVKKGYTYTFTNNAELQIVMQCHTVNGINYDYIEDVTHGNLVNKNSVEFTATQNATHLIVYSNGSGNFTFGIKDSFEAVNSSLQNNSDNIQTFANEGVLIYKPSKYGSFNASGYNPAFGRVSTEIFPFKAGNTIYIANNGSPHACGVWKNSVTTENFVRNDNTWRYSDEIITPDFDGYLIVIFKPVSGSGFFPISDCNSVVTVFRYPKKSYDNVTRSVCRIAYGLGRYNADGVPQQSIIGYLKAYFMGYRIMLCDLRFTNDGYPICFHDSYFNQTYNMVTDENGTLIPTSNPVYVDQLNLAQFENYDFGRYMGESFKGTKILQFKDMVALCKYLGCELYVEQKTDMSESEFDTVFKILADYDMIHRTTWCPQSLTQLNSLVSYFPNIGICLHTNLVSGGTMPDTMVDAIINATNAYNYGRTVLGINPSATITEEQVNRLQLKGIGLHVIADSGTDIETIFSKGDQYHSIREFLTNGFIAGKYLAEKQLYTNWFLEQ